MNAVPGQRLDQWLWAARLFKTRTLAAAAVEGGKVRVNGVGARPARRLTLGDILLVTREDGPQTLVLRGFNPQRRPASEARLLYEETVESLAARAAAAELRRLAPLPGDRGKRPTKRDRRQRERLA